MTTRTLLNVLVVVSMLASTPLPIGKDRLPAPLYAAPGSTGSASGAGMPPAQATETPGAQPPSGTATETVVPTPTDTPQPTPTDTETAVPTDTDTLHGDRYRYAAGERD